MHPDIAVKAVTAQILESHLDQIGGSQRKRRGRCLTAADGVGTAQLLKVPLGLIEVADDRAFVLEYGAHAGAARQRQR